MCRALRRPQTSARQAFCTATGPRRDDRVNRMRSVATSARVNLNERWKSLEELFAAADRDRPTRAGDAAAPDEDPDGQNARPTDPTSDAARRLRVDR